MEAPRGANPDVVVAVAVPVVDVETVLVEVADTRDITSIGRSLLVFVCVNEN